MNETEKRLEIGMLLYPGLTLLDLIGPQTVFSWFSNIHLVWKTTELIRSDTGIDIKPTATLSTCPRELDVLFVPGGFGQQKIMGDPEILSFLADRGSRAKYITSVCSGSLLLAAAGLLNGYKATSHWAAREGLAAFGAVPTDARVVVDRNRVTGGGVTAGIDFGLVLLAQLRGDHAAKLTQLAMEYDPQPPFRSGTPKTAELSIVHEAMSVMASEMERLAR
jgi:cyclohexyl-isocyanide hydratase